MLLWLIWFMQRRRRDPLAQLPDANITTASPEQPYLLLTLTALFWSGNMRYSGRGIRADIPPMALAARLAAIIVLGLLGVGNYNTFAYIGLQTTTASNAVLPFLHSRRHHRHLHRPFLASASNRSKPWALPSPCRRNDHRRPW